MNEAPARPRVAVVGGGISGLTAAVRLASRDPAPEVVLLEGSARLGGKLRSEEIAGVQVDVGAEAMLARRPEATGLAQEVGLAGALAHPAPVGAGIWARGGMRAFPRRMVQGVPGDLDALRPTGVLTEEELREVERLRAGATDGSAVDDASVGEFLRPRIGSALVDRLVEPLLGGVYAGRVDRLSTAATLPQLAPALAGRDVFTVAAEAAAAPKASGPVFAGLPGGVATLATAVADAARAAGVRIRTSAMVRGLARGDRFRLTVGPTRDEELLEADAVILTCPAVPASRLLAGVAPEASRALTGIPYASTALVTLAVRRPPLPGSGFLAAAGELPTIKAATYSATKWPWLAQRAPEGVQVLRASIGRFGDEHVLQRDDADLVAGAVLDLETVVGRSTGAGLGDVVAARVTRWGGGLPQYEVGHRDRVAAIRRSVAAVPGLAVAGAAYDGIGIPACIADAGAAVEAVIATLEPID